MSELRANLAAHLRSLGHPLAGAVTEGELIIGLIADDEVPGEAELVSENQAAGALELGERVVLWRPAR